MFLFISFLDTKKMVVHIIFTTDRSKIGGKTRQHNFVQQKHVFSGFHSYNHLIIPHIYPTTPCGGLSLKLGTTDLGD